MLETFVGPRPEDSEVAHLNENSRDNNMENLAYVTRSENAIMNIRSGDNLSLKLTMEDARKIRRLYASGNYSLSQLGDQFDVSKVQIFNVVKNKQWKG